MAFQAGREQASRTEEGEAVREVGAGRQGFEKLSLEAGAYLIGLEHMSSRLKILNLPR